jgi:hypothetical protein
MKVLIDECLHTSLLTVAHEAGHACDHVNFLGLGGYKDWQLMAKIRAEDYTLVTNNRADFIALREGRAASRSDYYSAEYYSIHSATAFPRHYCISAPEI